MAVGYLLASVLPASVGGTLLTLGARGLFTVSMVAFTPGLFSGFRCFQEAHEMIAQNVARIDG
jgi:hypothetical protein